MRPPNRITWSHRLGDDGIVEIVEVPMSDDLICLWHITEHGETCLAMWNRETAPIELLGQWALRIKTDGGDGLFLDGTAHQHMAWIAAFRAKTEQKPGDFPPTTAPPST